jgi:D-arabinose 1-dehydrogenase-like Zn-dependent alcohol dehydrogenase
MFCGQRVGIGFLGGSCGHCGPCRDGDLVNCRNQKITGVHHDGGYAEVMIAKANGLMSVPDDLSSADAAPLLCAGLTAFSALRNLSYGGGAVNQVNIHLFIESMPFGGTGAAGIGHYYGKYGFDMLTHAKSMLIAPPEVAIDHLFPPYTKKKNEALALWFEY